MDEVPPANVVVLTPDEEPTGPGANRGWGVRGRALVGLLALVLAAAVLVALNRVAAQRIFGSAMADWPQPPALGSCIDLHGDGGGVAVVPCDSPHDAEVTKSYPALDPVLAASPSASIDAACADAARAYLGDGAMGDDAARTVPSDGPDRVVALGLSHQAFSVGAPAADRAGDLGWQICVVQPTIPARYAGSVHGATPADAPDAYHWCWSEIERVISAPCTEPHAVQVLGVAAGYTASTVTVTVEPPPAAASGSDPGSGAGVNANGQLDAPAPGDEPAPGVAADSAGASADEAEPDRAEMSQRISRVINETMQQHIQVRRETLGNQCAALAAAELEVADPTFGGLLRTTMVEIGGTSARVGIDARDPSGHATVGTTGEHATLAGTGASSTLSLDITFGLQYCLVVAPDGRALTHSLTGWGDRPPPLAASR